MASHTSVCSHPSFTGSRRTDAVVPATRLNHSHMEWANLQDETAEAQDVPPLRARLARQLLMIFGEARRIVS